MTFVVHRYLLTKTQSKFWPTQSRTFSQPWHLSPSDLWWVEAFWTKGLELTVSFDSPVVHSGASELRLKLCNQGSNISSAWAHWPSVSKPELLSLQIEGNGSRNPGGLWWGFNEGYKWSAHRLPATWEVDACHKPMLSWAELLEQEAKKGYVSCG